MTTSLTRRTSSLLAPQLDYLLVDGSHSMMEKWYPTLAGLENFLSVLKSQNIHSHGILNVFDSNSLESIQRDGTLASWPSFSAEPLVSSWGGTPLYDAINLMGRSLRDLDPKNASIVIVTDGEEMSSRHTTIHQARAILDWCRAKGWQVTFLGADFDNAKQAKMLGANPDNTAGIRKELLADAGRALGEKRARHAQSGTEISFSPEEKATFGGYLTGPSK